MCNKQLTIFLTLVFSEEDIKNLAPTPGAFIAGKKLSDKGNWLLFAKSERAIWGQIKGSGKNPYSTQLDIVSVAYKCSCPSRQFPCKHSIALMLLYADTAKDFPSEDEPEWVKSWLSRRESKVSKELAVEKDKTPEEHEKSEQAKQKNQEQRLKDVSIGVEELELWLKDLVRMGFLELPNKPKSEFLKVASRMVDSKAPGLASWVKSLAALNFENPNEWHAGAVKITAKLYLLIKTYKNYDKLDPLWKITIKNLLGWNQSSKELLAMPDADTQKDEWLIIGQETEEIEEIVVQRNWLVGCKSHRNALILNFASKFQGFENNFLPGTLLEAELAFFPSVIPHRAVVKMQRKLINGLNELPEFFTEWKQVFDFKAQQMLKNPWINDLVILIKNVKLRMQENTWCVCDKNEQYVQVIDNFDLEKILKWQIISGNRRDDIALIIRDNMVFPLGIFSESKYQLF